MALALAALAAVEPASGSRYQQVSSARALSWTPDPGLAPPCPPAASGLLRCGQPDPRPEAALGLGAPGGVRGRRVPPRPRATPSGENLASGLGVRSARAGRVPSQHSRFFGGITQRPLFFLFPSWFDVMERKEERRKTRKGNGVERKD